MIYFCLSNYCNWGLSLPFHTFLFLRANFFLACQTNKYVWPLVAPHFLSPSNKPWEILLMFWKNAPFFQRRIAICNSSFYVTLSKTKTKTIVQVLVLVVVLVGLIWTRTKTKKKIRNCAFSWKMKYLFERMIYT